VVKRPVMNTTTSEFRSAIYVVRSDGSGTRQLTGDPDTCSSPVWSPEGKRIAYLSLAGKSLQILIVSSPEKGLPSFISHR